MSNKIVSKVREVDVRRGYITVCETCGQRMKNPAGDTVLWCYTCNRMKGYKQLPIIETLNALAKPKHEQCGKSNNHYLGFGKYYCETCQDSFLWMQNTPQLQEATQ